MRTGRSRCGFVVAVLLVGLAAPASAGMTTCRLAYVIKGWSIFYKTYKGTGTVTCENGERARVAIETHGGGLTIGRSEISGDGRFSEVRNLAEVYGVYAEAGAHAGATKSADARVLTKGEVSLALTGKGRGVDLGIAFGAFEIKRP